MGHRKADDSQDDGGTRTWRANQATWGSNRVIDVTPERGLRRLMARLERVPTYKLMLFVLFLGFGLPMLLIVGGVLFLALSDAGLIRPQVLVAWVVASVAWRGFRYRAHIRRLRPSNVGTE